MKHASVLIRDFPDINNQCFTYSIPERLIDKVKIGSIVFVSFGLKHSNRIGIVLEIKEADNEQISVKDIEEVIQEYSNLTERELNYLKFISLYFFIPLSNLLDYSNILRNTSLPTITYKINLDQLDKIGKIHNKERIVQYLKKHENGFKEVTFKKNFKLKKNSSVLINLEKKNIIKKEYLFNKNNLNIEKNTKTNSSISLINNQSIKNKIEIYRNLICDKNTLMICPNINATITLKRHIETTCKNIIYGSKISLIDISRNYDLIIIDDILNSEYEISKPFNFDIEKAVLIRSLELNENIVLSSYIPSIYSYIEIRDGRIKHINKDSFSINTKSIKPEIIIVDLKKEFNKYGYTAIPGFLRKELDKTLSNNRKSLVLINRKGYYNLLICKECGYTIKCPLCTVPLTYHIEYKNLICRYCGHIEYENYTCPNCGGVSIRFASSGTEKLENDIKKQYKDINVIRIDRNKYPINPDKIPDYNIAVGTSLSLELLNMEEIDFVAIMGIDTLLNQPTYKSVERTTNFISRVYERMIDIKQKKILIPTFTPYAGIFRFIKNKLSKAYYASELNTRLELGYPPYVDMYEIELSYKQKENLPEISRRLYEELKSFSLIKVISLNPMLSQSPNGIYRSRIIIKSDNILNSRTQLGIIIDSFRKREKVNINIRNMG